MAGRVSLVGPSTDLPLYRFAFATAVLLEAGKVYLAAVVNAAGTGTTAARTTAVGSSSKA